MNTSSIHNPYLRKLAQEIQNELNNKVSTADLSAALSGGTIQNTSDLVLSGVSSKLGVRTTPEYTLDVNGESRLTTLQLTGGTTTYTATGVEPVDLENRTSTYIAFGETSASTDFAYLRQIGEADNYHMTLDFHDTSSDGKFSMRTVGSSNEPTDLAPKTLWTTQHDRTTFYQDLQIEKSGTGADSNRTLKVQKDNNYISMMPYVAGWNELVDTSLKDKMILFSDNSSVNQTSRLVIGPHLSGTKAGLVIGNNGAAVYGKQEIVENGGGSVPDATTGGTLTIRRTSLGSSSIVFPSIKKPGFDMGYIQYKDSNENSTGQHDSALIIGVATHGNYLNPSGVDNTQSDSIRFQVTNSGGTKDIMTLHSTGIIGSHAAYTNYENNTGNGTGATVTTSLIDLTNETASDIAVIIVGQIQHGGIKLPYAFPGRRVVIYDHTPNNITVYTQTPDVTIGQDILRLESNVENQGNRFTATPGHRIELVSIPYHHSTQLNPSTTPKVYGWMGFSNSTAQLTGVTY